MGMWDWEKFCRVNLRVQRICLLLPCLLALTVHAQTCAPGEVRVVVIDSQESPVFDALVSLSTDGGTPFARSTQTGGLADFQGLPCGSWKISVEAQGFEIAAG